MVCTLPVLKPITIITLQIGLVPHCATIGAIFTGWLCSA